MKFQFEKFMKDIVQKENDTKKTLSEENKETPQRTLNKLYREKWQNRIKFRRKK